MALARHGGNLLVAARDAGLQILDVTDPARPLPLGSWNRGGSVEAVAVHGPYVLVGDGVEGLTVLDLADPRNPRVVGEAPGTGYARGIAVSGAHAYVSDSRSGVRVYDVSDPARPRALGGNTALSTRRLLVAEDRLLAAAGDEGVAMFELFSAPLELEALAGTTREMLTLKLSGPEGTLVVVQRSTDLARWQDAQEVTLTASPVTISVPAASTAGFFRLKKP
jgi:hypothetical protein